MVEGKRTKGEYSPALIHYIGTVVLEGYESTDVWTRHAFFSNKFSILRRTLPEDFTSEDRQITIQILEEMIDANNHPLKVSCASSKPEKAD